MASPTPRKLDLDRRAGLTVTWSDGRVSHYPVLHLRRLSPSADARQQREQLESGNGLVVLESKGDPSQLRAEAVEPVGRYAVRIRFSDGHDTGIYSWDYLREIDPDAPRSS